MNWWIIGGCVLIALIVMRIVFARRAPVSNYRNRRWNFTLHFPEGWTARGSAPEQRPQPEFDGPNRSSIKFAIGPIRPVPTVIQQRENLRQIATKHGHECLELGSIHVAGSDHATMICRIPIIGVVKNYSVIFNGTEFLVTARGALNDIEEIVRTFALST